MKRRSVVQNTRAPVGGAHTSIGEGCIALRPGPFPTLRSSRPAVNDRSTDQGALQMTKAGFIRAWATALAFGVASVTAIAQPAATAPAAATPDATYKPSVGQEGKDVVWVPTPQVLVDKMLDMAKMTSNDYV